jgi:hypothetical protein
MELTSLVLSLIGGLLIIVGNLLVVAAVILRFYL